MEFNINNYLANMAYINKDFNSIWNEIIEFVPKLTNSWKPGEANESDPLVVLLKELGIVEDKLNYNIDKNTLEQFPDLLTQLRTAYSVFKSMGYVPNWYRSAVTQAYIIYNGGVGETNSSSILKKEAGDIEAGKEFSIPKFTQISNEDFTQIYTILEDVNFQTGRQSTSSPYIIEGTCNDFEVGGNTLITLNNLDAQNRLYFVQPNVAQNGIFISSDGKFDDIVIERTSDLENLVTVGIITNNNDNDNIKPENIWRRVNNIYQYLPGEKVFKFGIDPSNGSNYIQFPDDIGEIIGEGIYIKYILSSGNHGNIVSGALSTFVSDLSDSGNWVLKDKDSAGTYSFTKDNFTITNNYATQNGKDPETIEEMQKNYERVVGTFDTLVTLRDYENYIYNAEDAFGQHLVANVRVSDRSNDLFDSYTCVTQDEKGTISKKSLVERVGNDGSKDKMTAYNLRLYPLYPKDNINTLADFNTTFKYPVGVNGSQSTPLINAIINKVENVKTVLHDWSYDNVNAGPIFVDYDLSGQIYLQKSVSRVEALEIQNNISTAIYRAVNSRNLTWGEQVNYTDLVNVIKNADSRIQYVALNAPHYHNVTKPEGTPDVIRRSILAGVTPWTKFSKFKYFYEKSGSKGVGGVYPSDPQAHITKIQPKPLSFGKIKDKKGNPIEDPTLLGFPAGGTVCQIRPNETLSILIPGYRTESTYSNYFYAVYGEPSSAGKIVAVTNYIPLNTPYTLGASSANEEAPSTNECIYIFETRDDAQKALDEGGVSPAYTLGPRTIITISGSGTQVENGFPSGKIVNMGSKITISTIVPDENYLYNTNNPNPEYDTEKNSQIKILTNSQGLIDYLKEWVDNSPDKKEDYTLDIGEYLLFSNYDEDSDISLEVGIIGEGNTIKANPGNRGERKIYSSLAEIQKSLLTTSLTELGSADQDQKGIIVDNNFLSYRANTIYNFGANYQIQAEGTNITDIDKVQTGVQPLTGATGINYKLSTDTNVQSLPKLAKGDVYKYSYQLSLTLTPGNYQSLEEGQEVVLEYDSGSDTTNIAGPKLIQANKSIVYSGGSGLNVSKDEGKELKIKVSENVLEVGPNNSTSYFYNYKKDEGSKYNYKLPSDDSIEAFIIPYIFDDGVATELKYKIAKKEISFNEIALPGTSGKHFPDVYQDTESGRLSQVTGIGPLYAISSGAKYYNYSTKEWESIKDIVESAGSKDMDEGELELLLGVSTFCPIYQPTELEEIEDPSAVTSYFNAHHPFNRYVLPRLIGEVNVEDGTNKAPLDGLRISELSIRG